jgi:hypothetical protein
MIFWYSQKTILFGKCGDLILIWLIRRVSRYKTVYVSERLTCILPILGISTMIFCMNGQVWKMWCFK